MTKKKQLNHVPSLLVLFLLFIFLFITSGFHSALALEKGYTTEKNPLQNSEAIAASKQNDQYSKYATNDSGFDENFTLNQDLPGSGTFLYYLLNSLTNFSSDAETRFSQLIVGFPKIFPDLYKVFITL